MHMSLRLSWVFEQEKVPHDPCAPGSVLHDQVTNPYSFNLILVYVIKTSIGT